MKYFVCLITIALSYWFMLPPLNFRSGGLYAFIAYCIIVCTLIFGFSKIVNSFKNPGPSNKKEKFKDKIRKLVLPLKIIFFTLAFLVIFSFGCGLIGSEIFNSGKYFNLITIQQGDFTKDISEINKDQIPVVDRDSATILGLRKLGEMYDLVSQFEVTPDYTQINYLGKAVRVTPLAYGDTIKWLNNNKQGIPAYIKVDMTTQETALVRLQEGMKYSKNDYFMRNINRYARFKYPTKIFETPSFEIDEQGTPYWVIPCVTYRIGLWSGKDIEGAILINAIDGSHQYFKIDEIPSWVDQIYSASMINEQLNYNGKYRQGYFNSIFGQKGVLQTTEGYNYLAIDDDVYLYTGMTSVGADESNVGFVLCNLRTKETKFYAIPGAEEFSAMDSAEGQVQNLGYISTFPLLLNVGGRPCYFVSLKDEVGLVKMYAFVDVQQYQIVGTGYSITEARNNYLAKLSNESIEIEEKGDILSCSGTIIRYASAVINGYTHYFFMLDEDPRLYEASIEINPQLAILKEGDFINMTYIKNGEDIKITNIQVGE